MRGVDITQEALFTKVHLGTFVPKDHPLRAIKILFDQALTGYWMAPIPSGESCRFHPSGCCEHRCYKCFIQFAASGN